MKKSTIHEMPKVQEAREKFNEARKKAFETADAITDPIERANQYREIAKIKFKYYWSK